MKSLKKIPVVLILFSGLVFTTFESCSKYPDGPLISFHSRTERVAQTWKVDNYKMNGNDYTSAMSAYRETYTQNGAYSYSWGSLAGTGAWSFSNNDDNIQLIGISNQKNYTLVILKLEQKEFWYYYMDGNDKKEFHMIQN